MNKDQLAEALALGTQRDSDDSIAFMREAARLVLAFPSDEDVRVAEAARNKCYQDMDTGRTGATPEMAMRAALEAVRDRWLT